MQAEGGESDEMGAAAFGGGTGAGRSLRGSHGRVCPFAHALVTRPSIVIHLPLLPAACCYIFSPSSPSVHVRFVLVDLDEQSLCSYYYSTLPLGDKQMYFYCNPPFYSRRTVEVVVRFRRKDHLFLGVARRE